MSEPVTRDLLTVARQVLGADVPLGEFHLLAVGIEHYAHCPRLPQAAHDARELARVLQAHYGFAERHLHLLLDSQATRPGILGALRKVARSLGPDDHLLIAFFGHGNLDDLTGKGSWVPAEASLESPDGWISNGEIRELLAAMKARHVLVISDSCFSGDLLVTRRAETLPMINDEYARRVFPIKSRQALTSGRREVVVDGVFGRHLVRHLEGCRDGWLAASDLFQRVRHGVVVNAEQVPQFGTLQFTDADLGGEFVFFRAGAATPLAPPLAGTAPAAPRARADEAEVRHLLAVFVAERSARWTNSDWQQWLLAQRDEESLSGWRNAEVEQLLQAEKQRWLEEEARRREEADNLAEARRRATEEAERQHQAAERARALADEEALWQRCQIPGTIEALEDYLRLSKLQQHKDEGQSRLRELQAERVWAGLKTAGRRQDVEEFLHCFSGTAREVEARQRLQLLADEAKSYRSWRVAPAKTGSKPPLPFSAKVFAILNIVFGGVELLALLVLAGIIIIANIVGKSNNLQFGGGSGPIGMWTALSIFVSLVGSPLELASGIWLLKAHGWARKIAVGYAIFGLGFGFVNLAVEAAPFLDVPERTGPELVGGLAGFFIVGALLLTYNLLKVYFLTRPAVKRATGELPPALPRAKPVPPIFGAAAP